ncbi:hypothetical protein C8255_06735 [filamentous cyanobacterium CCP3]|nr:hypothetical protein C8255_06735 [filamentous cyanobacterium CCP3]
MNSVGKNPLIRDGVTQQQRQTTALSPDFARIDERDLADFLVFVYHLSKQVTYYNLNNESNDENWQAFFDRSPVIQLALISKTRPEAIQQQYELARRRYLAQWAITPAAASVSRSQRLGKLGDVLAVCADILNNLVTWSQQLADDTSLKPMIRASTVTNLKMPVEQLVRLEKGLPTPSAKRLEIYRQLAASFHLTQPDLFSDEDRSLDLRQLTTNRTEAQFVLDGLFQPLFQTYLQIIQQAPAALEQSLPGDHNLAPHLSLLIAFWQVLQPARDDLNRMAQRHLDFFYREVLRLAEKPAQPDRTHVIFELAKFQDNHILKRQIALSAGTDATGADLVYSLTDDLVVNTAQVVEVKGLFRQAPNPEAEPPVRWGLHESAVADSADGRGGTFPQDKAVRAWLPFGDRSRPPATLGFAIASPLLLLQEGDRTVTLALTLSFPTEPQTPEKELSEHLRHQLVIDFSGEADWIPVTLPKEAIEVVRVGADNNAAPVLYVLTIVANLPPGRDPVLPYHAELPGGSLRTAHPVMRLVLHHQYADHAPANASSAAPDRVAYHLLQQATLRGLTLTTEVKGVRNLLLQSDLGPLETTQSFQPFGPQPKTGNSFYIGSQEIFQKPLTHLRLSFDLETDPPPIKENKPDWVQTYAGYRDFSDGAPAFEPGRLAVQGLRDRQWQPPITAVKRNLFSLVPRSAEMVTGGTTETANTAPEPGYAIDLSSQLAALQLDEFATSPLNLNPPEPWTHQSKSGFLRVQLVGDDFLHSEYPTVLARQVLATATHQIVDPEIADAAKDNRAVIGAYYYLADAHPAIALSRSSTSTALADSGQAVVSDSQAEDSLLDSSKRLTGGGTFVALSETVAATEIPVMPKEPYTPVITALQIDYTAELKASETANPDYCQLFHLHPFEGLAALPQTLVSDSPVPLLPRFDHEGELLIGLRDVQPATAIALLVQVAEETADTDTDRTPITWHYLIDNTWQPLEKHLVLQDTSNGLIHPGIVKLAIPPDISNAHTTILNPALHWIKATVQARSRAIGSIVSLHTQAAEVVFTENGNDPHHLDTPLPAKTIADLAVPEPEIRQILQPYPSFGGQRQEPPARFYTRISEHLRHKGRAVTIFDYEHLVLEQFPSIHKVRCINHSHAHDKHLHEIAPGHITLAVIPQMTHERTFNDLQPKANINLLHDIEKYLKSISSPWASIRVINPEYDKLRVAFQVQFRDPFQADFAVYRRQLERDIIGFLSPWTVNENAEIHFGGEMHLSAVLDFVEKRPYVDYLVNFRLFLNEETEPVTKATAKKAHSILVSVSPNEDVQRRHQIEPIPEGLATSAKPTAVGFGAQPLGRLQVSDRPG